MSLLYKVTCDGKTLLDQTRPGYYLTEAKVTGEINSGIFDGQFNFAIYADNPNYDAVHLMTSTIVVREEANGASREIFRGRPITVEDDFNGVRHVTCEGEMKFLVDIPNVFGKLTSDTRTDIIGNESTPQVETMVPVPKGAEQRPKPMYTGYRNVDECQLTHFGENRQYFLTGTRGKRPVYRNSVVDNEKAVTGTRWGPGTLTDPYNGAFDQGRTRFCYYSFNAGDLGLYFDVIYREGNQPATHYIIPLKACSYTHIVYCGNGFSSGGLYEDYYRDKNTIQSSALYLGNIGIVGENNRYFNLGNFNPEEEISIVGENGENLGTVMIGALPFVIVHYTKSQHWFFTEPDQYITVPLLHWQLHVNTVIYAVHQDTSEPIGSAGIQKVELQVYKTGESTVQAVSRQVFCRKEDELFGYNLYADESRRIFRGRVDIAGKASLKYSDSCYASLEEWMKETNGYARIRRVEPSGEPAYSVLDLTPDSGVTMDDFYVRLADNLADASRNNDCTGIVSGVFVRGTWDTGGISGKQEITLKSVGDVEALTAQDMNNWVEYAPLEGEEVIDIDSLSDRTDATKLYRFNGIVYKFSAGIRYLYIGARETYKATDRTGTYTYYYYRYDNGKWVELPSHQIDEGAELVASPQLFTDTSKKYGLSTTTGYQFVTGHTYYVGNGDMLTEDEEAHTVVIDGDYEVDYRLGVIWHKEARATYGSIIFYYESDVSDWPAGTRLQRLAEQAKEELQSKLTAFESLDISAVDPRLISADGGRPELGNYYPVEIPHFGVSTYKRLTRVETDLLDPNASKLTFGGKTPMLSDYVAKKGERND